MKVLIITRTNYCEPPRIRHQTAQLLINENCAVVFSQKPKLLISRKIFERDSNFNVTDSLKLIKPIELIHHQLRILPILHRINAMVASRSLVSKIHAASFDEIDLIINFNYDAYWLRKCFPNLPIITIINDDFEAHSRLPFRSHLTWALKRTCKMSNRVLAVSETLCDRLSSWCTPELFLPWAPRSYSKPSLHKPRNTVLFWGYVNHRIDFDILFSFLDAIDRYFLPWKLRIVGPIDSSVHKLVDRLSRSPYVEILPPVSFSELVVDDCVAALNPYKLSVESVNACQLSNKSLQLLSLGLPLICSNMPFFHHSNFVIRYGEGLADFHDAVSIASSKFWHLQPEIEQFVNQNGSSQRLVQLMAGLDHQES